MAAVAMLALPLLGLVNESRADAEPNVEIASQWWPELTNVVTPVAWRDHPHRFCVIFDGTILALPQPQKLLRFQWDEGKPLEGVQLGFAPSADGAVPPPRDDQQYPLSLPDGSRVGDQGWAEDHAAPVLRTRWKIKDGSMAGLELRKSVFAHMAGRGEAQTGTEAMFAWIRLEVTARDQSATAKECGFLVKINAPHMRFEMSEDDNCRVMPQPSRYPAELQFHPAASPETPRGVHENGNVRLAITSVGKADKALFSPASAERRDHYLYITMPASAGQCVDLLLPMIPQAITRHLMNEVALGFDDALKQADAFWSSRPATAARIHTPEPLINAAIENNVRFARMLTLTVPETGQKSILSGAMFYSYLWVTPTCMTKHMLLDPMGWHGDVAKYLEIYREEQGRVAPPGPDFKPHPGHFGVPRALDSGNQWMSDHGFVLYTVSRHALLTGDERFIQRWTEPIVKACDFIIEARRLPRQPPAAPVGVLPPASMTDISAPMQAFVSDAANYKGLVTAARFLTVINHPRAKQIEQEAEGYREAIAQALRAKAQRAPQWTDAAGRQRPIVPMTLTTDDSNGLGHEHPFYLDCGAMFGVYAGVLPADDDLMRDAVDFFREGPHVPKSGESSDRSWRDPPYLIHEMSSAEPCYSWNVFHSHQLADRQRYLECMYSLFTGALSRQTHISCETRGGITENVFASTMAVNLARLAVIDDEVEPGHLHLLRLAPLAWISQTEETIFENMPTEFGPVTLKWQLTDDGNALRITYEPRFRRQPTSVTLHVPPVEGLQKVVVNNQDHIVDWMGRIRL